jgi:hypothetical protein
MNFTWLCINLQAVSGEAALEEVDLFPTAAANNQIKK